jgi:hypothetical protein
MTEKHSTLVLKYPYCTVDTHITLNNSTFQIKCLIFKCIIIGNTLLKVSNIKKSSQPSIKINILELFFAVSVMYSILPSSCSFYLKCPFSFFRTSKFHQDIQGQFIPYILNKAISEGYNPQWSLSFEC